MEATLERGRNEALLTATLVATLEVGQDTVFVPALKTATTNAEDARALFLDERTSDATLSTILPRLRADSNCGLDVRNFMTILPVESADANPCTVRWLCAAMLSIDSAMPRMRRVVDLGTPSTLANCWRCVRVMRGGAGKSGRPAGVVMSDMLWALSLKK